jgi:hypothetical protein
MDKVTDAKTEFRLKQWAKIIQACQASGTTVTAWCRENNVNVKSYYYWLRRLRTKVCEAGELALPSNGQQIVPLAFKQTKPVHTAAITIHLSSVSIDIHEGTSKSTIETVLSVLKNIC